MFKCQLLRYPVVLCVFRCVDALLPKCIFLNVLFCSLDFSVCASLRALVGVCSFFRSSCQCSLEVPTLVGQPEIKCVKRLFVPVF